MIAKLVWAGNWMGREVIERKQAQDIWPVRLPAGIGGRILTASGIPAKMSLNARKACIIPYRL